MAGSPSTQQGVRTRNLSLLLRTLYFEGEQSRAELTRSSGLNRSTVADLVADLVGLGLAEQRDPAPARAAGRPSPIVSTSPRVLAIAVNPELDAVEIAAVRLSREVVRKERVPTPRPLSPGELAELLARTLERWRAEAEDEPRLLGVGLAVPGIVRAADGLVRLAPHLGWSEAPVGELVERATGLRAHVANDATLGAVAEHRFGAARGHHHAVYLNGGASGVGGGVIVADEPLTGASGYAGEIGHSPFAAPRGGSAALERIVSRRRVLDALGAAGPGSDADGIAAAIGAARAPGAEPALERELAAQREALAAAIASAANLLNPSVVVLGGYLAALLEAEGPALRERVRELALPALAEELVVVAASLGEDRLLVGAADAVFARILERPGA